LSGSRNTETNFFFGGGGCEDGAVQAQPDPAPPDVEKGGSREPATMEET
jgi:hypothetical protein